MPGNRCWRALFSSRARKSLRSEIYLPQEINSAACVLGHRVPWGGTALIFFQAESRRFETVSLFLENHESIFILEPQISGMNEENVSTNPFCFSNLVSVEVKVSDKARARESLKYYLVIGVKFWSNGKVIRILIYE